MIFQNRLRRMLLLLAALATLGPEWSHGDDDFRSPRRLARQLEPLPEEVPAPRDNPTTDAKVALGKQLFFDPRLSGDNSMSCATCHLPDKAWADGKPTAEGRDGKRLPRNTPGLLNVGFYTSLFWDGRATSLEAQALEPIQSADEMHQDLDQLEPELAAIPGYVAQFQAIYGEPPRRDGIARSLAAFQRTLVSRDAPFDRYLAGDQNALSPAAKEGLALFVGDAGCVRCHSGPLLSDGKPYRLGASFRDHGLGAITGQEKDRYKFRTPTLRDVAETAPYMHDGSLATLDAVVEFYYRSAPTKSPDGLTLDIEPLTAQSYSEIPLLVAFLKSLSGKPPAVEAPELP